MTRKASGSGYRFHAKGFKLSGRRLVRDIKQYDVAKQNRIKGGSNKIRYVRRGR